MRGTHVEKYTVFIVVYIFRAEIRYSTNLAFGNSIIRKKTPNQ